MNFTDQILTEKNADKLVITVYIESKNQNNEDFYAFMNMSAASFEKFTLDANTPDNEAFDLTQYGLVIFSNMGKANDAVKESIADMLGCDINEAVNIPGPAHILLSQTENN